MDTHCKWLHLLSTLHSGSRLDVHSQCTEATKRGAGQAANEFKKSAGVFGKWGPKVTNEREVKQTNFEIKPGFSYTLVKLAG
jgi:hypothetical protein